MIRGTASRLLEGLGWTVPPAVDGADGLEVYRRERGLIDAVLLDMVMPRLGGRDGFRAIRALDPDARVVMASGFTADHAGLTPGRPPCGGPVRTGRL